MNTNPVDYFKQLKIFYGMAVANFASRISGLNHPTAPSSNRERTQDSASR